MSKVFVTQHSPHLRFAEANEYGEVVFLTDKEYMPQPAPERANHAIKAEIVNKMKEYIPGTDYIVVTGSAIPNLIVGAIIGTMNGPHRVLKWSNRMRGYELFLV